MKRIAAGDRAAVGAILDNAQAWERDWWNGGPNADALAAARAAIEARFGAASALAKEIRLWEAAHATATPDAVRDVLLAEGYLLGPDGRLPETSWVAKQLLIAIAQNQLAPLQSLAERFAGELERRARGPEPDPDALFLLGALLAQSGQTSKLREIDRYGWERYRNPDFALSLLQTLQSEMEGALRHDDPLLAKALADFPEDPRFAWLAFDLARKAGEETPDQLARLIDAEFHGLRSDESRYSYALNLWFQALAERLPASHPAAPDS